MNIAEYIDHTLLKPDTTEEQINRLCEEAMRHEFAAVCVPPMYVALCRELLEDSDVHLASVIGFPYGYSTAVSKVSEADGAISDGADELDVVINLSAVKSGRFHFIEEELRYMKSNCEQEVVALKYIIEYGALSPAELKKVLDICNEYRPEYVKTSTGVISRGAEVGDILHLRSVLKPEIRIKASGGIRSREQALALIDAGADRIGTSAGVHLLV